MPTDCLLTLGGQTLHLLPERAAFWQEAGVLLVADLHLGKAAHLRYHGIAIPEGHTADDLERLSRAIRRSGAREVLCCGDFFHAPTAQSPAILTMVEQWRASHPDIPFTLITGNHDQGRALPPVSCGIDLPGPVLFRSPFCFIHDPAEAPGPPHFTISGHLHPVAALPAGSGRALRAPCFWYQATSRTLVLPAFSTFTAVVPMQPPAGDLIFSIHHHRVTPVPSQLCQGGRPGRQRRSS